MTVPPQSYSPLQVEAALCIWECWLDSVVAPLRKPAPAFQRYWKSHGTAAMRHLSIELADYCLSVYDHISCEVKYGHPYDWEVIPAILGTLDWEIGPHIRLPAPEAAARATAALDRLR
jgi:hypothetical protein